MQNQLMIVIVPVHITFYVKLMLPNNVSDQLNFLFIASQRDLFQVQVKLPPDTCLITKKVKATLLSAMTVM